MEKESEEQQSNIGDLQSKLDEVLLKHCLNHMRKKSLRLRHFIS